MSGWRRGPVAQKITTLFIDDIDGGAAEGTVRSRRRYCLRDRPERRRRPVKSRAHGTMSEITAAEEIRRGPAAASRTGYIKQKCRLLQKGKHNPEAGLMP